MSTGQISREFRFMLLLATACSMLLMVTRAGIGERAELNLRTVGAVLQIIGEDFLPVEDAMLARFKKAFVQRSSGRVKIWRGLEKPELWACEATGNGLWAEITLVFVYNAKSSSIAGLRVTEQNETAGLGSQITDEDFFEQFTDIQAGAGVAMSAVKIMSNQFDAVSGATMSSKAVEKIVNHAINLIREGASAL